MRRLKRLNKNAKTCNFKTGFVLDLQIKLQFITSLNFVCNIVIVGDLNCTTVHV